MESKIKTVDPTHVDVTIIDGMFFLHLLSDLPSIFGAVATFILKRDVLLKENTIHFVLDKTVSPSIKDCERDLRCSNRHGAYHISGPEQKSPTNLLSAIKEALVECLAVFL